MDGYRVSGVFHNEKKEEETIVCKWKEGKKEVFANEVLYEKITDHIGRYAAVMIAPDDLQLINEGSEQRRKWIDAILCQTDKEYFEHLLHYQRVLLQRNAWLKIHAQNTPQESAEMDYYNQQLAHHGHFIFEARKDFIVVFLPLLEQYYQELSGGKETISLFYKSDLSVKPLMQWYQESLSQDLYKQRTGRGIHKDEFDFGLNEESLKQFGSQGQKKCFLFAMKLAQYVYLHQQLKHYPILLLDDVFEKLDHGRIEALMRIISSQSFGQVLLTDTDANRMRKAFGEEVEVEVISVELITR